MRCGWLKSSWAECGATCSHSSQNWNNPGASSYNNAPSAYEKLKKSIGFFERYSVLGNIGFAASHICAQHKVLWIQQRQRKHTHRNTRWMNRRLWMYLCVYIWIFVCVYVCLCIFACVCVFVYLCVCVWVSLCARVCVCFWCVCVCICVYLNVRVSACACVYLCVPLTVCECVCVCIYVIVCVCVRQEHFGLSLCVQTGRLLLRERGGLVALGSKNTPSLFIHYIQRVNR